MHEHQDPRRVQPVTSFVVSDREQRLLIAKRRISIAAKRRLATLRRISHAAVQTDTRQQADLQGSLLSEPPARLEYGVDEFSYYRGVLHVRGWASSPDRVVGAGFIGPAGEPVLLANFPGGRGEEVRRFEFDVIEHNRQLAVTTTLIIELGSGDLVRISDVAGIALRNDPVAALNRRFQTEVQAMVSPRVLEVGARARSGNVYRSWLPKGSTYVGCDILPGENVDVVGDAHSLSTFLPMDSFDAVFSVSTMEHLAMPWVAAAEMNRVTKVGGYVFVATHQTWPVHDAPWDFYRFSEYSWVTLFNQYSGFEIVAVGAGEPGKVVANVLHPPTNGLELQPAFLSSAVLARKISSTNLVWNADAGAVVAEAYPG